jgi:hypothetical protein
VSAFAGDTRARKANKCGLQETANEFSRFYGTKSAPAEQTPANAVALAAADYRSHAFPVWEFVTQLRKAEDQLRAHDELVAALKDVLRIAMAASIGVSSNQPRLERARAALAKVVP